MVPTFSRVDDAERGLPRAVVILVAGAAGIVVVAGMSLAAWLVGPLLLAMMIVVAVRPVSEWLRARGWPSWAATSVLVLIIYLGFAAMVAVLVVSAAGVADLVPGYADRAQALLDRVGTLLSTVDIKDPGKLLGWLGSALDVLSGIVFLLSVLLFLGIDAATARARHDIVAADRPRVAAALVSFAGAVRRYLWVTTVFGFLVAVLDVVGLALLGIPLPLLWGVLSFITNYVPTIGFVLGVAPPAVLGLLQGGWPLMTWVVVLYCVMNFLLQSVIQPRFVGDAVGLSVTATFLSLILWGWVLGPLGAVLAIPLTLLAKALLVDVDPRARWVNALLDAKPAR
ncbi:Predicted PurR-regulated permease PerM [Actinokineospora terrae]|uniref:Predicted PurR-regulated permease PerM n=1 Tax=Actinokineospora terrae TaxID=155974 RepID=A0A1H9MEJ3_9PSEU|nr:Predicted PurR-regulated permease PerM [Actinokineospora terrae]